MRNLKTLEEILFGETQRITVQDYKKICKVGDVVRTNGDAISASMSTKSGKVVMVTETKFFIELPSRPHDWQVHFRPDEGALIWVEVLQKAGGTKGLPKKKGDVRKLEIKIERVREGIGISLIVPKEVEEYYKSISGENIEASSNWFNQKGEGVKYYELTQEVKDKEQAVDYETFSDYGSGLLDRERINTAILRSVGASNGIVITSKAFNKTNNADLQFYIEKLGLFVKKLWETSISEKIIKASITYEL